MGLFSGRFPPWLSFLNGPFARMPQWAVFPLENPLENSPFRKGALKVLEKG